ncbi:MAG: hypothetical protein KDD58_04410 [Bdellovibrionales bacterium]|nr:hypothetical protein [Bdellovibrionales bacterium]
MRILFFLFCFSFIFPTYAQTFSPLAPSADLQIEKLFKPLKDHLLYISTKTVLVEDRGSVIVLAADQIMNDCHLMTIHWESKKIKDGYEDKISFKCNIHFYKEILQIRKGNQLKPFELGNWFNFQIPNLENLVEYKFYLNWSQFELQWHKKKRQLLIFGFKNEQGSYKYKFTEKLKPRPKRKYEFVVSDFDFIVEQETINGTSLNTFIYRSSEFPEEATGQDFTIYIKFLYDIFSTSIPSFLLDQKVTTSH